ncbi:MAG TPA: GntR family transcriptional regulator [Acidiphilium sp.]
MAERKTVARAVTKEAHNQGEGTASETAYGEKTRTRLGEDVAESLRRAILNKAFKPGERLIEDRLSAEFGVSRVPIREAIKTLIAEGLVVPTESRGVRVAEISQDLAEELVEVRAMLEGMNARLAARHRDPEVIERLRDTLARGNAAVQRGTASELAALNREFHELLGVAGSNRVLMDVVRTLRERTDLVFQLNSVRRAAADWHEHALILAAVIDGDEELAMIFATRHVRNAARARLETG